jgi:hypothetical protein
MGGKGHERAVGRSRGDSGASRSYRSWLFVSFAPASRAAVQKHTPAQFGWLYALHAMTPRGRVSSWRIPQHLLCLGTSICPLRSSVQPWFGAGSSRSERR